MDDQDSETETFFQYGTRRRYMNNDNGIPLTKRGASVSP
jgi:hypothetical protein